MKHARIGSAEMEWLQNAIASFNETAVRLEKAYRDLESEKRRIDLELERKNRELAHSLGNLDALLSCTTAGVVSTDAANIVRVVNRAAEQMLGIRSSDWVGSSLLEIAGDREDLLTLLSGSSEAPQVELRVRCLDDRERNLRVTVSAIEDASGQVFGAMRTITDMTEIRDLEESLAQRNRMAEMGEMSSVLAHQIRNPLNGIAGFGRLILERLDSGDSEAVRRYAENIVRGSRRLETLVHELLRFTRDDAVSRETVDLVEVVAEAVEAESATDESGSDGSSSSGTSTRDSATTRVLLPSDALTAHGDGTQLREAIANLIHNARDAAGPGGTVRIDARREGDRATIRIHDCGPGMDRETRERIFHPFFTTKESGYGLGLPIARKLIERHRGTLTIRTRPGRGCRARIELPLAHEGTDDGSR